MLAASAAIPALAWYAYVGGRTAPYAAEWLGLPFSGILSRSLEPRHYGLSPLLSAVAVGLDYLALAGMLAALVAAIALARRAIHGPIELAALMFACLGVFLGRADVWQDAYGFPRVLTPLLLLPALRGLQAAGWIWAAPMVMVEARVVAQLGPQISGVLGLTS